MDRADFFPNEHAIHSHISSIVPLVTAFILGSSICCFCFHYKIFDNDSINSFQTENFTGSIGFTYTLLRISWMYFAVLLLSTSWIGFWGILLFVCFKGFSLSALYIFLLPVLQSDVFSFLLHISSLLTVISLIILSEECMNRSKTLYSIVFELPNYRSPLVSSRRIFPSFLLLTAAVGIRHLMISFL